MAPAPQSTSPVLLENALVLSDLAAPAQRLSVAVEKGRIAALGSTDELRQRFQSANRIDLSGHAICPGLINAHMHASMSFFRGLGQEEEAPNDAGASMIENFFFPLERALTPELIGPLAYPYLVGALKTGTSFVNDAYFFMNGVGEALDRLGMRGAIGEHIADLGGPQPAGADVWAKTRARIENWPHSSRVLPVPYAHATDTVSFELLKDVASYSKKHNLPFHMHLAQTFGEDQRVRQREGISPVLYAQKAGALHERSLVTHLVSASREDLRMIRDAGAVAALCPISEIIYEKLPQLPWFWEEPMRVALGTDCAASNDGSDMWDELRVLSLLLRDKGLPVSSERLAATLQSEAAAVFLPGQLEGLKPGMLADLCVIELDLSLQPLHKPLNSFIFSGAGRKVRHMMIDGRWTLWDGQLALVNEKDLSAEFQAALGELQKRTNAFPPQAFI